MKRLGLVVTLFLAMVLAGCGGTTMAPTVAPTPVTPELWAVDTVLVDDNGERANLNIRLKLLPEYIVSDSIPTYGCGLFMSLIHEDSGQTISVGATAICARARAFDGRWQIETFMLVIDGNEKGGWSWTLDPRIFMFDRHTFLFYMNDETSFKLTLQDEEEE
jgi:hypothetical protein